MSDAVQQRVRGMISRGVVTLVDDEKLLQEMQIEGLADERHDGVERFQEYGFTSRPFTEAEAIAVCVGGLRSHMIVIGVGDRRYRLKGLEEGEVAMHDDLGNVVKLGREQIEITAASKLVITAPDGVEIDGDVTVTGDVVADGISLRNHTHGGVQAGGASTGAPA